MANFFKDNPDLVFTLENLDLEEVTNLREHGYRYAEEYDNAPVNYADASDNFRRVLEAKSAATGSNRVPAPWTPRVLISRTAR